MENQLDATTKVLVSSGGVFEVEYENQLIYSKKKLGRFPEQGEVVKIVYGLDQGLPLADAQKQASLGIAPLPSFTEWLTSFITRKKA
ncbi:MAG: Rdx family protein [Candidatus Obscuribacterales bacterium]|nr:Rdx family protein [Candidatus Obscuribacterales bacterium]